MKPTLDRALCVATRRGAALLAVGAPENVALLAARAQGDPHALEALAVQEDPQDPR